MARLLLLRAAQGLLVLWAAFTLSFALVQLMPGDAVLIRFMSPDMGMTPEDIAMLQAIVLLSALAFVVVNLLVDVLSALIDPRLRRPTEALA